MPWKARLVLVLTMSSVMVAMVTLLVTYLNLGLPADFAWHWAKAYLIAWPVAAATGYFIMPSARRLTDRIVAPPRRNHLMLSALDLARRIAAGGLTPAHVLDLCAEAIARREPQIGAFTALDLDAARRAAAAPGLAQTPLAGLPIGIKDIYDTADMPTAYGSPIYAGHRPASDAAMVMLVRRAGGVIAGKTVTAAFASREDAPTRNPLDPLRTPGGSSSGSAAAVAAGLLPVALGSQTGGSTIRPAAYCGVAGYKPSFKLLPTVGMKCFSWSLDTVGLFAAGVADVAFAATAISGRDLRVDGRPPPVPAIAIVRSDAWDEASAPMQSALEQAARTAERAGATITELPLPAIFADASRAHRHHRRPRSLSRARLRIRSSSRPARPAVARTTRRSRRDHHQ